MKNQQSRFKLSKIAIYSLICVTLSSCDTLFGGEEKLPSISDEEIRAGGATTVFQQSSQAFSNPAPNLDPEALEEHLAGDLNFEKNFVTAPAEINGGLGPLFNNLSCINCHVRDGRGKPFFDDGEISAALVRISSNPDDNPGEPIPVDGFGLQIQHRSTFQARPEARIEIEYETITETLGDGTEVELNKPIYNLVDTYKPLPPSVRTSVRTAPPVFGLGLLEAIPESDIVEQADPNDLDGDGISGKPNYVTDVETGEKVLGRFGWKANQPSLLQQSAAAYNGDMGVTSSLFPEENLNNNPQADDGLQDDPEISDQELRETAFYVSTLGVPSRRNTEDKTVRLGKKIFLEAGCVDCHTPSHKTAADFDIESVRDQTIFPFTDLLLHDMGEGLADNRSDFEANGREWRTAPLWGIGLTRTVNGHLSLLHDGRAKSFLEAILWHGGEAERAKNYVKELSENDRDALIEFIKSL